MADARARGHNLTRPDGRGAPHDRAPADLADNRHARRILSEVNQPARPRPCARLPHRGSKVTREISNSKGPRAATASALGFRLSYLALSFCYLGRVLAAWRPRSGLSFLSHRRIHDRSEISLMKSSARPKNAEFAGEISRFSLRHPAT
jgi:hypothetical protein